MGLYSSDTEINAEGFTSITADEYYTRVAVAASRREQGIGAVLYPDMF